MMIVYIIKYILSMNTYDIYILKIKCLELF